MAQDENLYVAPDGKRYRAVEAEGCDGCAFHKPCPSEGAAKCASWARADSRSTIWVPDDAPAAVELTAEPAFPGTLRDWFAGMALSGLLSAEALPHFAYTGSPERSRAVSAATEAYEMADAMMKARGDV